MSEALRITCGVLLLAMVLAYEEHPRIASFGVSLVAGWIIGSTF